MWQNYAIRSGGQRPRTLWPPSLYECLTGKAPYTGDNYNALLFAIQQGKPTPLSEARPELDPALIAVIERGMATEADARFQSAEDMVQALEPWLSRDAASSAPPHSGPVAFAPTVVPRSTR